MILRQSYDILGQISINKDTAQYRSYNNLGRCFENHFQMQYVPVTVAIEQSKDVTFDATC